MKYLNGVLTVIAICLVLITFAVTGLIPSANAKRTNNQVKTISVPVNEDGSITVKFAPNYEIEANISSVGGHDVSNGAIDINIDRVADTKVYKTIPVKINN